MTTKKTILFGYSGHSLVVHNCLDESHDVIGYLDREEKKENLLGLNYLGHESVADFSQYRATHYFFPAVGSNAMRKQMRTLFLQNNLLETNAIHFRATIGFSVAIGMSTLIGPNAVINSFSTIGNGVIINSGAIVEHECRIEDYVHIAPGCVLAGNVIIGEGSFIGANSTVREGITIGKNVTVGAGSVVLKDIPDNEMWAGVPANKKK